jgi:hypothetical protein
MKKVSSGFEDLLNSEYRWPRKGDRLLRRSDDWDSAVQFSQSPMSKHAHQWTGYMSAAAGLIELCAQKGYEHERHTVIYPILFNYRHGLELAMKWIIVHYGGQVAHGHDLWKLWKQCRKIMESFGCKANEADEAVEQIIKEFHDLDEAGITFRYGWSKDGKEIMLPDHLIDLSNIRDVMEGVAGFFEGLDGMLDSLASAGP